MTQYSTAFSLLDERIQRAIWKAGWTELRDAQEKAIPAIIGADRDVIISAATAAGKTEAAFFPALTYLLKQDRKALIVYVGPLKALINDQFARLEGLCESLEIPVWPWHGDISATTKARFLKEQRGVLLITPESLEATLCNRSTIAARAFLGTALFIVDELHAFIGTERGKQLQSLLHRIEVLVDRRIPRIGLSATLGDMHLAADHLRPGAGREVHMVSSDERGSGLKILVKGYKEPRVEQGAEDDAEVRDAVSPGAIAAHLFTALRGTNNLVFPNSRKEVERYTFLLNRMCGEERVPNEFWPHHGSLSKAIRFETEAALKGGERPATAVCTNTLELGIDIGAVRSVAQIGSPHSVASLRQRLGRSGRRAGEPAILRGYIVEDEIGPDSPLHAQLRLGLVQCAAMITLLVEGWFEPPAAYGAHLSTLVQQLLAFIAQNGGATASQAYKLLCSEGAPFERVDKPSFAKLLRELGERKLIFQDGSGLLLHGELGEKMVNHYTFYAAFATDDEYRISAGSTVLGSLPISSMLVAGQFMLFAGRTWRIDEVDDQEKVVYVSVSKAGRPPLFSSGVGRTHTRIRQRMRELLSNEEPLIFLDQQARTLLEEGRGHFQRLGLGTEVYLDSGPEVVVFTWLGDGGNEALAALFRYAGLEAYAAGPGIEVRKDGHSVEDVKAIVRGIQGSTRPALDELLFDALGLRREKWDWALPDELLRSSYASHCLDFVEAEDWLRSV